MLVLSTTAITLLFLVVASLFDLKSGEIPDRVTIGLIIVMLAISSAASVMASDAVMFASSLFVGAGYFAAAYALYRLGQWGGGDVKLFAGVGCSLGLLNAAGFSWKAPLMPYYIVYFIDMGIIAMPYALAYMLSLSFSSPAVFHRFREEASSKKSIAMLAIGLLLPVAVYTSSGFTLFLVFSFILPAYVLVSIFLKTSEETLLSKTIPVSELKETDAVAEDIAYQGERLASRREIEGVSRKQLDRIKQLASEGKIPPTVRIRWGVKFAPIILAAFILTLYYGDILALVLKALTRAY